MFYYSFLSQAKVPYNENLVENLIRVLELGYRNGKRTFHVFTFSVVVKSKESSYGNLFQAEEQNSKGYATPVLVGPHFSIILR